MSKSQLNKIKSWIKNGTEVILNLSSNGNGNSTVETNFLHKLLLTNTQVLRLCKAFTNNLSAYIELAKTQPHKIGQSGGFLGRLLGPLLKNGLPLMKNTNDIMKIIQSGLLIKRISETKNWFLGMLSGTLGATLLGNLLTGIEVVRADEGTITAGGGTITDGQGF